MKESENFMLNLKGEVVMSYQMFSFLKLVVEVQDIVSLLW